MIDRSVPRLTLTITCPDRRGIVAEVGGFLSSAGMFIEEAQQFGDRSTDLFFQRLVFVCENGAYTPDTFAADFAPIADKFQMTWHIRSSDDVPRVLVMVSKFDHCLNDLLYRTRTGWLNMDISAVVSNHEDLRGLVERADIPYHHIPVSKDTKPQAEAQLMQLIADTNTDLVVLARYMQVLSDDACRQLPGRVINIHHSFLPSFKGAKPYHQAFERGVKLIGATAHYVTPALDEGPIIEQLVERVDHSFTPEQLVALGRDVENLTLARALKYHLENRVFLNGSKTVVFK